MYQTIIRWISQKNIKCNNIILWAGDVPPDSNLDIIKETFSTSNLFYVVGDNDEFINESRLEKEKEKLMYINEKFNLLIFNGKHVIHKDILIDLSTRIANFVISFNLIYNNTSNLINH